MVYYSEGFETYDPAKHVATYAGEMLDISKRGACIITNHFFQQGSKIKLTFRDMGDFSTIAMVRWCREGDDGTYQVGLQMPK
ncbi:MAG: hypothetical protein GWM98_24470, partial [Nitrospinaceae bacterium]|nr:PilZ domain-containing protein [Nitrospinaceae bacterium]NIY17796.1 hypothetical protein [Nitrospinaceae bacterium]